ncbi:Wadjet anti-phage system protein JetD domain-containing protein [uncultured Endozoicomonas sp.]|uniref:Wadjet anti-phage system protein JetD domain-containing protein n=1 Tax=uncultured Endozoicomonas sp. TaxID=432652 RepID=UPI00262D6BAC|nr:Wadjet anti-phage system protein JetD domain-containing protein [uncultured Endozoicomonas sp.]
MSQKIASMLNQVANGEPIRWITLVRAFVKEGFQPPDIEKILVPVMRRGLTQVTIVEQLEFDALRRHYPLKNLSSKATAALSGNTHDARNRSSLLNVSLPGNEFPVCAIALSREGWTYPFEDGEFAHDAVIIENLENFLFSKKTRHFIAQACSFHFSDPLVLIWGGGRAAEKEEHLEFLQRFHRVHVLPDLDFEGLAIASRLSKKLNNFGEFLLPVYIDFYISMSSRHMSPEEAEKLQKLALREPDLSNIISKLVNAEVTIEQELYLLEPCDYDHI